MTRNLEINSGLTIHVSFPPQLQENKYHGDEARKPAAGTANNETLIGLYTEQETSNTYQEAEYNAHKHRNAKPLQSKPGSPDKKSHR